MTLEGFIPSTVLTGLERLLMPTLTDVLVTIIAVVMVLCVVMVLHLVRYH